MVSRDDAGKAAGLGSRMMTVGMSQALVVIADPLAEDGLALLRQECRLVMRGAGPLDALTDALAEAEALIVRSETRVTADLLDRAPRLRVIGRAGAGVDTIDVEAA